MLYSELQSPRKVVHMARGNIDPISMKKLDDYSPAKVRSIKKFN